MWCCARCGRLPLTQATSTVECTAIKRTHDGRYQAVADEGENGFDTSKAESFLSEVYEPTFSDP